MHGAKKPQAMRLEFIQHPQDGNSDAAVHFVLAPSYVTYNAATIQRVQEFFRTEEVRIMSCAEFSLYRVTLCWRMLKRLLMQPSFCKHRSSSQWSRVPPAKPPLQSDSLPVGDIMQVMDFSALGAQAVAQVERAQRAAREQLIAAMNQRPKLSLKLELEGPKIAIPVPEADPQGGSFHWRPILPCSCSTSLNLCNRPSIMASDCYRKSPSNI